MGTVGDAARLFSSDDHSALYAAARPTYPPTLYDAIFNFAALPSRQHALDIATGSGQVAIELAKTFNRVTATDASASQLANAIQAPNIIYIQRYSEDLGDAVESDSIDLITVAQALHWFNLDKFFTEMRRIIKKGKGTEKGTAHPSSFPDGGTKDGSTESSTGGTLACWGYGMLRFVPGGDVQDEKVVSEMNAALQDLRVRHLGPWWDERRVLVDDHYKGLDEVAGKYFAIVETRDINVQKSMSIGGVLSYIRTWSAYQSYMKEKKEREEEGRRRAGEKGTTSGVEGCWEDPIELFHRRICESIHGTISAGEEIEMTVTTLVVSTPHFLILAKEPRI